MRRPRHFNVFLDNRWPWSRLTHWLPRFVCGWSAGKLTLTTGVVVGAFAAWFSLHFYERGKPVNPYWIQT